MIEIKKYYFAQFFIFILTFFSYAFLHANRKSFTNVKSTLEEVWTECSFNETVPKLYPESVWRSHHLFKTQPNAEIYLGVLDTVFMGCYAFGLYVSGYLGDRFDPRYVLGIGMSLSAIVIFVFGVVTELFHFYNVYLYTILYGLNGLCQSTGWPAAVALMGNWFGNKRGFWLCLWSSCAYVGNIIGDLLTGNVLKYGYLYGFLVPATMLLSGGLLVIVGTVTSPNDLHGAMNGYEFLSQSDDSVDDDSVKIETCTERRTMPFYRIVLIPGVIPYSLAYACLKMVNYAFFFWLPVYLFTFGLSNADADQQSIWFDVGSIVGGIVAGLLSDYMWSRSPVTVGSLVLTVVALAIYRSVTPTRWLGALLLALVGVFIGGPANLISATIAADLGSQPLISGDKAALATVTGIIDGTGSVGAAIGQVCVPLIAQQWQWSAVFVFFMIMISLTVVLLLPVLVKDVLALMHGRRERRLRDSINAVPFAST